jgi:hypothetical protein
MEKHTKPVSIYTCTKIYSFYSEIEKSLTFVFRNMKENKFKVYKWKLIHYILPCKEVLFKWHITTNNLGNNCQIVENDERFSFEYKRLETFWRIRKQFTNIIAFINGESYYCE